MARPLRIKFCGALYHVTSRGDRHEPVFDDESDFLLFLDVLAQVIERFNWVCHSYCLMTNHYHLVIETPDANLAKGMRQLNGVFTQASNRKHSRTGHLFQGRYKAILVDTEEYLLELSRYVVLNPVRAGMVDRVEHWSWSSYRATVGMEDAPSWLTTDGVLAHFGTQRGRAMEAFAEFVAEGVGAPAIWGALKQQIYLGDDSFVEQMQAKAKIDGQPVTVPQAQRRAPPEDIGEIKRRSTDRNSAIVTAYQSGGFSYQQLADYFGVHPDTIGRIVRRAVP